VASGAGEIQAAFRSYPWTREIKSEATRQAAGEESCPPGLGISPEEGHLLHLCPTAAHLVVHYHYNERRRILGLFPNVPARTVETELPLSAADELIARFVAEDHDGLMRVLDGG
jgi:hypothetical protein